MCGQLMTGGKARAAKRLQFRYCKKASLGFARKGRIFPNTLRGIAFLCALLGVLLIPRGVQSQESSTVEYRSKANFLANLPGFVEWPKGASLLTQTPFSVCVLGDFDFGLSLAEVARGVTAHGRRIEIRWLKKNQDLRTCQILYVSRSEAKRYQRILEMVQGSDILTIGETSDFLDAGGAIIFSFGPEGLRFDVNLNAANAAHLKISSSLLALARRVLNTPEAARS